MKKILIPILSLSLLASPPLARAQDPANGYAAVEQVKLSPQQLDELVAPIALYPDPLVALILPASTVPTDVVLADRYVKEGKDLNQVDSQNWDPSVKSLTRYPDVLNMMDENLDWTNQLGTAVIAQQGDVMQAIQVQRAKANALGNLSTTPQQQVIVEKQIIQIVPADPQIIYVPQYNPQVVYVERAPSYSPLITFGVGFAMGAWLTNDCDWNNRGFYVNNWGRNGWHGYPRYTNVNVNINRNNYWRPNPHRPPPRPPYVPNRPGYAGGKQNLPAFRPPPKGGWNGGNNRPQTGQGNRPGTVAPGGGNTQTRPNRPNPTAPANPAPVTRPGGKPADGSNAQNKPWGNKPAVTPGTNPTTRPTWGNNGQTTGKDSWKNRPTSNTPTTGQQPNATRPGNFPGKTNPQTPGTPRPQPATPTTRPATPTTNPQASSWKRPATSSTQSQGQPQRTPSQSTFKPQTRPASQQQRPSFAPQGQQQRPQAGRTAPQARPQGGGQAAGNQQGWQRKQGER